MANAIDHLATLNYNAYIISPLFDEFFSELHKTKNNILLSYLLLPLIFNESSMNKIKNSNKNSSLHTIFNGRPLTLGLQERIFSFKEMTNKCLLLGVQRKSLHINNDLSISFLDQRVTNSWNSKDQLRASRNLGKLLNKHDLKETYRILGIRKL